MIYDDGVQMRDGVFSEDAVDATILAVELR